VGILNPIRAVVGIPHHRFNLSVKCSRVPVRPAAAPTPTPITTKPDAGLPVVSANVNQDAAITSAPELPIVRAEDTPVIPTGRLSLAGLKAAAKARREAAAA
jgi:hypothetical protein